MENRDPATTLGNRGEISDTATPGKAPSHPGRSAEWIRYARWLFILLIVGSLISIMRSLPFDQAMTALNDWIGGLGAWGPVVLAAIYVVATVLFVPGTILTLAAGALFGLVVGTLTVSVGSTVGAALAFLIARYVARDKVASMARKNRKFGAIDRAIAEGGWKIVALLRLSPAIPFNVQNYLYGLTPVRFWSYVLTSWLAMLPGTFLYIYLGHITGAAIGESRQRSVWEWLMLAVGLLATVAVTVYITRLARQKLRDQVQEPETLDAASSEAEETSAEATPQAQPLGNVIRLAVAAVLLLAAATYVRLHAESIEAQLAQLFGPPQVELQETYRQDSSSVSFDHSALDNLLRQHVDEDGWVDYQAIRSDVTALDSYLQQIAEAPFEELGRDEKLALLINAYNAATLKLIVESMPLESIMEIPAAERWEAERWEVAGHTWSLNQIEHEQIRPHFAEPRIHFALVCAAVGCPPLRNEAYTSDRVEEQLDAQARYVHDHETWFAFDPSADRVSLTKLYSWYGNDFEQVAGSVLEYAARYSEPLNQTLGAGATPQIEWLSYDWALNSQENRQPR